MRILALITARAGSKRLPRKNIRMLGGKPLLVWSIEATHAIEQICDVLTSTDDSETAAIARNAGALAPWLRPAELATDHASSAAVALHALEWYERERGRVDGLLLLQPTSPFRSRDTIARGIRLFAEHEGRMVVGVSKARSHPLWCFKITAAGMRPFVEGGGLHLSHQDLTDAYVVNGAFYLIAPDDLRRYQAFHAECMVPLIMERTEEGIDIDTEFDWRVAEAMLPLRAE